MVDRPELLIRADASSAMGTGHVMRCLALAQGWQDIGGIARFACHQLPESMSQRLQEEEILLEPIDALPGSSEDFEQLLAIARRRKPTAVAIDGYQFGQSYVDSVASLDATTLLIDDYGQLGEYRTSFVLNQNAGADEALYANRRTQTQLLLGPEYALIRRELRCAEGRDRLRDGTVGKILVTLGGSDPDNVTEVVVRGLMELSDSQLQFRVIVGGLNPHLPQLKTLVSRDSRFQLLQSVRNMAEEYVWADLAICAGGSSNWEMCCFGIPRLVIVIAENQRQIANRLQDIGIARLLGNGAQLAPKAIREGLELISQSTHWLRQAAHTMRRLNIGNGVNRCMERLKGVLVH